MRRYIFWLAIAGMALCLHLWVQKQRGFDRGCWGIAETPAASSPATILSGCRNPALEARSSALGIPIVLWGFAFYSTVAFLSLSVGSAASRIHARRYLIALRTLIAAGLICSIFLVSFQIFGIGSVCPLCMASAGVVSLLFLAEGLAALFQREQYSENFHISNQTLFATFSILIGLVAFESAGGRANMDAHQFEALLRANLPHIIEPGRLEEFATAEFQDQTKPLSLNEWTEAGIPAMTTGTKAILFVFLDPQCPHCERAFEMTERLSRKYANDVSIYIFSTVLWPQSIKGSVALERAVNSGCYYETWRALLKKNGPTSDRASRLLSEPIPMAEAEELKARILARRMKIRAAGIESTPTFFVDGMRVAAWSENEIAISKLIERQLGRERDR